MKLRVFESVLKSITDRIRGLFVRAAVVRVDAAAGDSVQTLQVQVGSQVYDLVAHPQPYGFGAVPLPGSEAHIVWPGGSRDRGIALLVADRVDRPELEPGEVAIFNRVAGTRIVLRNTGEIVLDGDVRVTGSLHAEGDVSDGIGSLAGARATYNLHTHSTADGPTDPPAPTMGGGA